MANRTFTKSQSLQKEVTEIFAVVNIGSTGACTLQQWNYSAAGGFGAAASTGAEGVLSITRTGTGAYSIVLQDSYYRFLGASVTQVTSNGQVAAPIMAVLSASDVTSASAPTISVLFSSAAGNHAADPDNGAVLYFKFTLQNSSAP